MTLSTPTNARYSRSGGFTLVEMLVVIGIIILLIGIILPAINIAYSHAVKQRMRGDIQAITTALEAYRSDMRTYPQLDYGDTGTPAGEAASPRTASSGIMTAAYPGSVLLCRALIAPGNTHQDGFGGNATGSNISTVDNPAPGFTIVPNGQVYGPYLEASRFKLVMDPSIGGSDPNNLFIADRYGHPILYFKAFPGGSASPPASSPSATGTYVDFWKPGSSGPRPMYNLYDDQGSSTYPAMCWSGETPTSTSRTTGATANNNPLIRMRLMLGDTGHTSAGAFDPTKVNGTIDGIEQAVTTQPYLLWSAGPDEVFGISLVQANNTSLSVSGGLTSGTWASQIPTCDDATNFRP